MGFIGCGKCSKYYFYLLIFFISQFICDLFTGFNKDFDSYSNINIKDEKYIKFSPPFQSHYLFQDLLKFLGALLSGICLNFYFHRLEKNKNGTLSLQKLRRLKKEYFGEKISYNYSLYLIGLMLSFSTILGTFLLSMELDAGFWTLEIVFLIFLSIKILKIHFGNHQKVAIFLILTILFILQIISTFSQRTKHNDCLTEDECQENYLYDNNLIDFIIRKYDSILFIPILIIGFIISFIMRDYSWVKSKYLIDIKSYPFSKILITTGAIGIILIIICYIIVTFIPCNSFDNANINNLTYIDIDNKEQKIFLYKQACNLMDYNEEKKILYFYYDNFILLINDYKNKLLQILIIPIYIIMNALIYFSQMMILKSLDSITLLINYNFNYFFSRLIYFIIIKADEQHFKHSLFILMEIQEIISIFAYFIYMEIIELKFCKLDYDLKKNIIFRSLEDNFEEPIALFKEDDDKDNKDNYIEENSLELKSSETRYIV